MLLTLLFWIAVLAASILVLVWASDSFVDSAEKVGLFLGLPVFVIGAVIVGFGTSLPEMVTSVISVISGSSGITIGNVLGSNIANIFLVLGLAAIVSKSFSITHNIFYIDVPFLAGSALLLFLMTIDKNFTLGEAVICLGAIFLYVFYSVRSPHGLDMNLPKVDTPKLLTWVILIVSPVLIYFSADFAIKAVQKISEHAGIAEDVISASAVAFGTSLPEVMVTLQAARKGKPEIAVGNVIGSNIFNTLAVMGLARLFGTLRISDVMVSFNIPMFLGATAMFIIITMDKKVIRLEGILLCGFYIYFICGMFNIV